MFKNYIKLALRNIFKQKFYSFINVAGLSIGIASSLLIVLYVHHELSYDKFHRDADRIYRVDLRGKIANQEIITASTCGPLAQALESEVPEIEAATRLQQDRRYVIRYNDKLFTENNIILADSNFFEFFSFNLLEGQKKAALVKPRSIVLTEEMAEKYFENESAVGKMLDIGETYMVTGVMENVPYNSHFRFDFLVSASTSDQLNNGNWLNNTLYTYFKLKEHSNVSGIPDKLDEMVVKYVGPELVRFTGTTLEQMEEQGGAYGYFLTKMTDIHLRSDSRDQVEPSGEMAYMYIFMTIAVFIILIACINFMNLSTARSASRAKEVGLRKTMGSIRQNLIFQFLTESMIYSLIATVIAYLIVVLVLPSFNLITGKPLSTDLIFTPVFLALCLGVSLLVGLLAGSYPAFYLTSFSVVDVLKGKVREGMKGGSMRSSLVVLQFGISIFLFICTGVVYTQLQYFQTTSLGMDKNNVIVMNNVGLLENREAFKNKLEQESNILAASFTNNTFPGINNTTVFRKPGSDTDHIMGRYFADADHDEVLGFKLLDGRFFSPQFPSDSTAAVINEAAAREFGWDNPVGEEFVNFGDNGGKAERIRVIGVVKDFNYETLKTNIRPLIIQFTPVSNQIIIRYKEDPQAAIATIKKNWEAIGPDEPFEYEFLDENYDNLFRAEQRMGNLFSIFTGLAIFIACLGLMGLAAFTAEKRTKEISIRKILGASHSSVLVMLNKEFTRLVIISFVIGAPIAWWSMEKWLEDFAFRVDISPWIFVLSAALTISVAWLTVSWQSLKAALTNPVDALKSE